MLNRRRVVVWSLLIAVLLLIEFVPPAQRLFTPLFRLGSFVEGSFYDLTRRARRGLERLAVGEETAARLADLESRLSLLSFDRTRLATLEEEREALRRLVNFQETNSFKIITTRVIGEDPRVAAELRLAVGSQAGVRSGAAVISPSGALVGAIADVAPTISTVRLLDHRLTQVTVRVLGNERAIGLLESGSGLSLRLTQIPKEVDIKPGDVIVTTLIPGGLPANLPVGTILTVYRDPQGLWLEATIAPLVQSSTLDIVSIVTSL
jgi:rod shape-determining protein MreC